MPGERLSVWGVDELLPAFADAPVEAPPTWAWAKPVGPATRPRQDRPAIQRLSTRPEENDDRSGPCWRFAIRRCVTLAKLMLTTPLIILER